MSAKPINPAISTEWTTQSGINGTERPQTNITAPTNQISLPLDGYSRASQLLPFLPIGVSTLWKWSKTGQFPAPVKLSPTVTAWRNKDVHDWFNQCNEQASIVATSLANDNNSDEVA